MQNHPVRQHWIPKTYLRSFLAAPTEAQQIYARDLLIGNEFLTSISNVAVMRHLYTLDASTDSPSYAVESALCNIEGRFTPVLEKVIQTEELNLSKDEFEIFARFLTTLQMRTRQGLAVIQGYRDEVLATLDSRDRKLPRAHAESLVALNPEGLREFFARAVISLAPQLSTALLKMNWRLLRTTGQRFITSENPFIVYHSSDERWGLATPGAHIQVPLTPRLLLHIASESIIPGKGTFDLVSEAAYALNGLTLASAEQYIFSSEPFENIRLLVDERPIGKHREFGPIQTMNTCARQT